MIRLITIASLFLSTAASAHDAPTGWSYDAWCCQASKEAVLGDCAQIRTDAVRIINGGYEIVLNAGDHPKVTKTHKFRVEQGNARRSKDEFYHICLYPTEDKLRCFYAPTMGF